MAFRHVHVGAVQADDERAAAAGHRRHDATGHRPNGRAARSPDAAPRRAARSTSRRRAPAARPIHAVGAQVGIGAQPAGIAEDVREPEPARSGRNGRPRRLPLGARSISGMPRRDEVHLVTARRDALGDGLHEAADAVAGKSGVRGRDHDDACAHDASGASTPGRCARRPERGGTDDERGIDDRNPEPFLREEHERDGDAPTRRAARARACGHRPAPSRQKPATRKHQERAVRHDGRDEVARRMQRVRRANRHDEIEQLLDLERQPRRRDWRESTPAPRDSTRAPSVLR